MKNVLLCVFVVFFSACSYQSGTTRIKEDNDFFSTAGKSDHNYTQGLDIDFDTRDANNKLSEYAAHLPSFSSSAPKVDSSTLTVGQKIYTPADLKQTAPIPNDNPYAGWLYTELTRHSHIDDENFDTSLSLGIVGPHAFGYEVQSNFHKLCGCQHPEGWDNQLHDEPAIMVAHDRSWIDKKGDVLWLIHWDSETELNFRVGNVHTDTTYTKTFRIGSNLDHDTKGFGCDVFLKTGATGVARNIFYDGNTDGNSLSVTKEPAIAFVTPGIHFQYKGFGIDISFENRTKDYQEETGRIQSFGMISLGFIPEKIFGSDN